MGDGEVDSPVIEESEVALEVSLEFGRVLCELVERKKTRTDGIDHITTEFPDCMEQKWISPELEIRRE